MEGCASVASCRDTGSGRGSSCTTGCAAVKSFALHCDGLCHFYAVTVLTTMMSVSTLEEINHTMADRLFGVLYTAYVLVTHETGFSFFLKKSLKTFAFAPAKFTVRTTIHSLHI